MMMKKVIVKKHLIFTFFMLLATVATFGQKDQPLPGNGTSSDPYHIDSDKEWDLFVDYVNFGGGGSVQYVYQGKYIKLNSNISASTSVGVAEAYFAGNFDGDGHTITLDMAGGESIALFGYVDGGPKNTIEIKNLTVNGRITVATTSIYPAGFVSQVWNNLKITSCTSSVTIFTEQTGGALNAGGFVGMMHAGSTVTCKFCVFDGTIDTKKRSNSAGFVGLVNNGCKIEIFECTQAYQTIDCVGFKTFFQIADNATALGGTNINVGTNQNTCYFLRVEDESWHNVDLSANPKKLGKVASTTIPNNNIAKKYTRAGQDYYVPTVYVSGMATCFSEHPTAPLDPEPVVSYYGKSLTFKTDYDYTINTSTKKVVFNATGDSNGVYYGTGYEVGYTIMDVSDWGKLKTALATDTDKVKVLKLNKKEYKPATGQTQLAIEGSGAVYLYLNGCTLNRGLKDRDGSDEGAVLYIGKKADVTIYGEGVITGGNNIGSGGGIRCYGKLQVYNVTFTNNEANYLSNSDYGTGGGIYCSGSLRMVGGEMSYNKSHGGGGGINGTGSSFYVEGVRIHDNYCNSKGGGIRVNSNGAIIKDCVIVDNELEEHESLASASDGGGIHNDGCNPLTVTNCVISRNNAYRWGGGVYSKNGVVYLEGCTIQQNTSSENGGGIYINQGSLTLRDNGAKGSTVTENVSDNTGGVFVSSSGNLYVSGTVQIVNNIGTSIRKNVFFANNNGKLVISGDLDDDSKIGVSRNNVGNITFGLSTANETVKRCIVSDNYLNYWVLRPKNGEVALAASFDWSRPTVSTSDYAYWRLSGSSIDYVTWNKKKNNYVINAPIIIPSGKKYYANEITLSDDGFIFIQDGGQLVYSASSIPVSVMKEITAASKDDRKDVYGWEIISMPITQALLTGADANVNIVTANSEPYNFDLLCYDEPNHYWRSYTDNTSSSIYFANHRLQLGKGYLYRNLKDFTIEFNGGTNNDNVSCHVDAECSSTRVKGFNLIGNPYTHDIYKGEGLAIDSKILNEGYFRLNSSGGWVPVDDSEPIKSCEGVLVQASKSGTITMKNTDKEPKVSKYKNDKIKFIVANSEYEDATYVMFKKGNSLNKIEHRNPDIPMLYVNYNEMDYAIATLGDAIKSFNLNFKATTTGYYTLSCKPEGEFTYLHVIDRITGQDVDMLAGNEYTFIGSPKDTEARFIVCLEYQPDYSDGNSDVFAYQDGSDIVVSGNGELQLFDVTGRLVAKRYINGAELISTSTLQTGVYILRLVGTEVKSQKMVVR